MNAQQPTSSDTATATEQALGSAHLSGRNQMTIGLLFYVVTCFGIISASLRSIVGDSAITSNLFSIALGAGAGAGFSAGSAAGLLYFRRKYSVFVATVTGTIVGLTAGSLALVQGDRFFEIATTVFGGCWILIVLVLGLTRAQESTAR